MRLTPSESEKIIRAIGPFRPLAIYLFGSHGTGTQHPASDLDIAFLPGLPASAMVVFKTAGILSQQLGTDVDLVDLAHASTVLRKEVIRTGEVIHNRDPRALAEFEMQTLSDYARLNEERREVLAPR